MNLGERIYKYRVSKNFSQGDLAEMLDVSRQSVSKWENNSATPDLDKIVKLSEIFGISIDELVTGERKQDDSSVVPRKVQHETVLEKKDEEFSKFSGRKIAGTILLCMAFLIVLMLGFKGALGGGIILSIPFIVCGIICFIMKQNTGLWCAWAAYFMIDIYLRDMTSTTRNLIFNSYYYTAASKTLTLALIVSWIWNLVLLFLAVMTVLRLKNKPLEMDRKKRILFVVGIAVLVVIIAFEKIFPTTSFYLENYVRNHVHIHYIIFTITDWIKVIISLLLIVNFVRYRTSIKIEE